MAHSLKSQNNKLRHMNLLLRNDSKITSYTTAVTAL
jgi:hypothetical protein